MKNLNAYAKTHPSEKKHTQVDEAKNLWDKLKKDKTKIAAEKRNFEAAFAQSKAHYQNGKLLEIRINVEKTAGLLCLFHFVYLLFQRLTTY